MINTAQSRFYCNTKLYREAQFRKKRYATRNKSPFSFNWNFRINYSFGANSVSLLQMHIELAR